MKKAFKIVLGIIGGLVVVAVAICVVVFSILSGQKNADTYELGADQIASVKAVVGLRDLTGISKSLDNGVTTNVYDYQSDTSAQDVAEYLEYLTEEEGFVQTNLGREDQPVYGKESGDAGQIVLLALEDTGFGYTLTIQKGQGTLTLPS